jgi:hypothetical protein
MTANRHDAELNLIRFTQEQAEVLHGAAILSGGLLGAPMMGGLATAMGWGAAGIGLYGAISGTHQYLSNQAETNTNIDPNKSLMPQDMKGHWGWVVASWVGVGLDIGAAVKAARLLKTGMTVEEVVKATSKAHNIPEELLRGAYTASGKGTSDPVLLKQVLTSALPKEIAEQAGKNLDVTVLGVEEFAQATGSKTGNAVTKLVKGEDGVLRAQVIVKEGADPSTLLEEAVHVQQLSDSTSKTGTRLKLKLEQLTEDKVVNWPKMSTEEQLQLYRTKIEVEIDAQGRLLRQYGNSDPEYLSKVQFQLDNLNARLRQTNQALKNPEVKPDWLDSNQAPRLFSKEWIWGQANIDGIPAHPSARMSFKQLHEEKLTPDVIRDIQKRFGLEKENESEARAVWHILQQKKTKEVIAGEKEIKRFLVIDPNQDGVKMTDVLKVEKNGKLVPIEVKNQTEVHLEGAKNSAFNKFDSIVRNAKPEDLKRIDHFEVIVNSVSELGPNLRVDEQGVVSRLISGSEPPT